jgi:hypothetical protein
MVYVACMKHWSSHSSKKPNINRIGISLRTDLVSGYFALRSALFLFTLILMVQCEKKKVIQNSELGIEQPTPPPSVPAISGGTQLYDQLSHVALNLAAIMENNAVNNVGSTALMGVITSSIPSGQEEVSMLTVDNAIATSPAGGMVFTLGFSASNDLYQAMIYCSKNYTISPALSTPRQPDFYSAFTINGKEYYTLLRIPEFAIQQAYNPSVHGHIIFVPKDVLGQNSYSGFVWNASTGSLNRVPLDDDIVDDHIDNSTAYIVVVDYDEVSSTSSFPRTASNCEGGWDCNDGYCDSICGEPAGCLDCNTMYNKRLILEQIRINDDERTSKGGSLTVIDKHFVSSLASNYRLCLNSVVLHANGKWEAINDGRIKQLWEKSQVKRVVYRKRTISRGSNTWKEVNLVDEPKKGILLSNHFNITQAKIYINIYERDFLGRKHDFFAPAFNGVGISNSQNWQSTNMPSLTGPAKNNYYRDLSKNPSPFQLDDVAAEVLPSEWANAITGNGYQTLEVTRGNVTFTLKVIDK